METFSALLALCEGNSPVTGEFPSQRLVTLSYDFLSGPKNKQLSKQSGRRWFDTPSHPLWHHSNDSLGCWSHKMTLNNIRGWGIHEEYSIELVFRSHNFCHMYNPGYHEHVLLLNLWINTSCTITIRVECITYSRWRRYKRPIRIQEYSLNLSCPRSSHKE